MAISTSTIGILCLLFVGLSIVLIEIKEKRIEVQENSQISTPKFGGLNQRLAEGPWPECLKLQGDACVTLLQLYTEGLDIELVAPNTMLEGAKFRADRVRVFVDDSNVVKEIPKRG